MNQSLVALKQTVRRQAYTARAARTDKPQLSRRICQRLTRLPEYQSAQTVLWYLHCRSEVQTRQAVVAALAQGRQTIVIPYCTVDAQGDPKLGLWRLQALDELVAGTWGILEPPQSRWRELEKTVLPEMLDLVCVPGVGFDREGNRLGNGMGYYDRLFPLLRPDAVLLGVGYECQLFERIPTADHDRPMHQLVTEQAVYQCDG